MSAKSNPLPDGAATPDPAADRRLAAIARGVLSALGRPPDFLRATVRGVTADDFRVNVLTGADPTTVRIAHSYFVTADGGGNLTASAPAIRRLY